MKYIPSNDYKKLGESVSMFENLLQNKSVQKHKLLCNLLI
jgi:hypothetical protein